MIPVIIYFYYKKYKTSGKFLKPVLNNEKFEVGLNGKSLFFTGTCNIQCYGGYEDAPSGDCAEF